MSINSLTQANERGIMNVEESYNCAKSDEGVNIVTNMIKKYVK